MTRPTYNYSYDIYGNLLGVLDPEGHTTASTYDVYDNPLTRTLPGGQTQSVQYDQLNQPSRKRSTSMVT